MALVVSLESDAPLRAADDAHPQATILSSVLNLSNTVLGTGLLALPVALKHAGMFIGILFAFGSCMLAGLSLFLLAECAGLAGAKSTATFFSVCEAAAPRLSLLVDAIVAFSTFAAGFSYLIVSTDSLTHIGLSEARWPSTLLSLAIVAPLSFLRSLEALKYADTLAVPRPMPSESASGNPRCS